MSRSPRLLTLALAAVLLPACSKDSTGPSVTFPNIPAQVLATYCVLGERTPNQAISGTLADTDCPFGDGSFYEAWRVRVSANGTYRFAASSSFDNVLLVLRLDSYAADSASFTIIASDDDSGTGTDALISSASLLANTDYFLLVNGFGATDVGPYTVSFTKP